MSTRTYCEEEEEVVAEEMKTISRRRLEKIIQ